MTFRASILSLALIALPSLAVAQQGTPEEQAACRPDVRKYCFRVHESDGSQAYLACLQQNREKLTAKCRAVLESHGV